MGIHIGSLSRLGDGFHLRASELSVDDLFDLADLLGVELRDVPESDVYDWIRQYIYDDLQKAGS